MGTINRDDDKNKNTCVKSVSIQIESIVDQLGYQFLSGEKAVNEVVKSAASQFKNNYPKNFTHKIIPDCFLNKL